MTDQSLTDLRESVAALPEAELLFLLEELCKWRDELAESRPRIADAINAALAVLDDDRSERPARVRAEVAELEKLATGHSDPDDNDGGFGWTAESPKQNT